jgi:hypothetical protein
MAQTEEKVTVWHCDAPNCQREEVTHNGAAPTSGTLGTVELSPSLGGGYADWYAHAPVHFGKAIKGALAQASTAAAAEAFEDTVAEAAEQIADDYEEAREG